MDSETMSSTVALTGMLPFIVLMASGLAFPVCFVLLKFYRRSVQKGMVSVGVRESVDREPTVASRVPSAPLRIVEMNGSAISTDVDSAAPTYRSAVFGPWRASMAYAVAGVTYALVMTTGWLSATRDEAIVWIKLSILF